MWLLQNTIKATMSSARVKRSQVKFTDAFNTEHPETCMLFCSGKKRYFLLFKQPWQKTISHPLKSINPQLLLLPNTLPFKIWFQITKSSSNFKQKNIWYGEMSIYKITGRPGEASSMLGLPKDSHIVFQSWTPQWGFYFAGIWKWPSQFWFQDRGTLAMWRD